MVIMRGGAFLWTSVILVVGRPSVRHTVNSTYPKSDATHYGGVRRTMAMFDTPWQSSTPRRQINSFFKSNLHRRLANTRTCVPARTWALACQRVTCLSTFPAEIVRTWSAPNASKGTRYAEDLGAAGTECAGSNRQAGWGLVLTFTAQARATRPDEAILLDLPLPWKTASLVLQGARCTAALWNEGGNVFSGGGGVVDGGRRKEAGQIFGGLAHVCSPNQW
ncbi:hypothetical protein B0H14DRAFT_2616519 [Mycena olivaceomarginata]|nr:hypothetical protein B0H14DRAFT_2616519 [Mycena olivaceomarginata]